MLISAHEYKLETAGQKWRWRTRGGLAACASRLYARGRRGHGRRMNLRALRISGIIASGALIAGAVLIAMTVRPAARPAPPAPNAPATAPASQPAAFAISLRGDGPLARAQRLAMRGGHDTAARSRAEHELERQRAFRGLCFVRFTPRGDIVVRACDAGTADADWQARLRAIPAVTSVDALRQLTQDGPGD
jgi:hypothetical protein